MSRSTIIDLHRGSDDHSPTPGSPCTDPLRSALGAGPVTISGVARLGIGVK